jgi:hypothetical protein
MTVVKGIGFVMLVVAVALGVFNGVVVAVSTYFGPFYESDAEQSRNFGLWLVGNGGGCGSGGGRGGLVLQLFKEGRGVSGE